MLYGLGALLEFEALYDIRSVRMTIVQPRLNNVSSDEITAEGLIHWAQTEVRPRALLAAKGEGRRRVLRGRMVPVLQGAIHMPQAQRVPHTVGQARF